MIKLTSKLPKGRQSLGLGISAGNVARLVAGDPIHLVLEELNLGWRGEIVIFYKATDGELVEYVKEGIGPQTIVHGSFERQKPN